MASASRKESSKSPAPLSSSGDTQEPLHTTTGFFFCCISEEESTNHMLETKTNVDPFTANDKE